VHGTFVNIGCEAPAVILPRPEIAPKSVLPAGAVPSGLPVGSPAVIYVWHRNPFTGRLYVELEPREHRGVSLQDLNADGVTPVEGIVLAHHGTHAFVDIGCESVAILRGKEEGCDPVAIEALSEGQRVRVYVRRRNLATTKVSLSLVPADSPRIRYDDVKGGGTSVYDAKVVSVQYGAAFFDFDCEVTGVIFGDIVERDVLHVGDLVKIRPLEYDNKQGRVLVELDGEIEGKVSETGTEHQAVGAPAKYEPPPLPQGWCEAIDPASGVPYYWHTSDPTATTTWIRPT